MGANGKNIDALCDAEKDCRRVGKGFARRHMRVGHGMRMDEDENQKRRYPLHPCTRVLAGIARTCAVVLKKEDAKGRQYVQNQQRDCGAGKALAQRQVIPAGEQGTDHRARVAQKRGDNAEP